MNISEPFVCRPVATVLLTLAIGLLGIVAYSLLPIASLPLLERPVITVMAALSGGKCGHDSDCGDVAVRAPARSHLRREGNVIEQHLGQSPSHSGIRPEQGH